MLCIYQENSNKNAKPQRKEQSDRIVAKHQSSSDMRLVAGTLKSYVFNLLLFPSKCLGEHKDIPPNFLKII